MQATLKLSSETSVSPAIWKSRKSEAGSLGSRPLGKATRGSVLHSCEEPGKAGVGRAWRKSEGEWLPAQWFLEPVGGFYKFYS